MKKIFLVLIGVFVVGIGVSVWRGGFITSREKVGENVGFIGALSDLPIERVAPELVGLGEWINSEPLTLAVLRGKVVMVDFWTYSCINCIRTFPFVEAWHQKYKDSGFVLLGVHSPEFDFEKKLENVQAAVLENGLTYPVVLDNDHATWQAFNNRYWPAHYLIDAEGNVRYTHFGEGRYAETEGAIQELLLEAGLLSVDDLVQTVEPPSTTDFGQIGTPEIYLGYARINNLGNMEEDVRVDLPYDFKMPDKIEDNRFYFSGGWTVNREFSESVGEGSKIFIRYKASKLNLVLASADGSPIDLGLRLDGEDISSVSILEPKLYNLVDTGDEYEWHTLEIVVPRAGLQAFAFTFG